MMRLLLDRGAGVNAKDNDGLTALMQLLHQDCADASGWWRARSGGVAAGTRWAS